MDLFLSALFGIIQLLLAGLGIYVSLKPPPVNKHKLWIIAFIVCGLLGIATGISQQYISRVENKKQQKSLNDELTEQKKLVKKIGTDLLQSQLS